MITKNMIFTANYGSYTIQLLCGNDKNGEIYYLPDDMFQGDIEIESQYEKNIPIGIPIADIVKLKIYTKSFTEELAPLGAWIRNNESTRGTATIPNVWIIRRGQEIEFIGVQQPSDKEKHGEDTYELTASGIVKASLETVYLSLDYASIVNTILDFRYFDYYKTGAITNASTNAIEGWGRTKIENVGIYLNNLWNKFLNVYKIFLRLDSLPSVGAVGNEYPTFYKQNTIFDDNQAPTETVFFDDLHIISEIWASESGNVGLNNFVGGFTKLIADKYKNLWNFYNAWFEGWGLRVRFIIGSDFSIYLEHKFINTQQDMIILEDEDYIEELPTLEESYNMYRVANCRNVAPKEKDNEIVSKIVSGGSTAKDTYESTCLFNNVGSTVDNHYHIGNTVSLGTLGNYDIKYLGVNKYKANSSMPNIPCNKLLYKIDSKYYKISEYCKINNEATSPIYNIFAGQNKDDFNNNINSCQNAGLSKLTNDMISEVLCKHEINLKCFLPIEKANNRTLGREYFVEPNKIISDNNYFYDNIDFGNRAVLVNIKENLSKGFSECIFFIRSDKWVG